ncbi:MAG: XRE family transcriptional regulator [Sphingobacteriales bacterium]|nr:MAG: XRE family transcriptional regulator [Sphingobacteriales bacterium]
MSNFPLNWILKRIIVRNEFLEIGKRLRERRELLGLLQPELAAVCGISTRTIQLVEMGKANPSLETLIKIADPLGLSITLFLKKTGNVGDDQ